MNIATAEDTAARLKDEAGGLLVRRAVDRDDWIADALLDVAAGDRTHWSPEDWNALLRDLRRTPGRVADWLDLNT